MKFHTTLCWWKLSGNTYIQKLYLGRKNHLNFHENNESISDSRQHQEHFQLSNVKNISIFQFHLLLLPSSITIKQTHSSLWNRKYDSGTWNLRKILSRALNPFSIPTRIPKPYKTQQNFINSRDISWKWKLLIWILFQLLQKWDYHGITTKFQQRVHFPTLRKSPFQFTLILPSIFPFLLPSLRHLMGNWTFNSHENSEIQHVKNMRSWDEKYCSHCLTPFIRLTS